MTHQKQENRLLDRVAIITGASSGIGRAAALTFAQQGAHLVLADKDEYEGKKVAELAKEFGREAFFIPCDIAKPEQFTSVMKKVESQFKRLDFAFNNAGVEGASASTDEYDEDDWHHVISVNLTGTWLCMKAEIQAMKKNKLPCAIVNCSSIAGLRGFEKMPAYVASKHGVNGLTKVAALECAKHNIRVNALCPGVIDTPMVGRYTKGESSKSNELISAEPIGRMGRPEEVAQVAAWLCSNESSFVTGDTIAVDGGWTAK